MKNNSPWIAQLTSTRASEHISRDAKADVVIVGGGIAGITTAYMILTLTNRSVAIIEGKKVAHGATGHNAGQIIGELEGPLSSIIERFGAKKTAQALHAIEIEAWMLFESIMKETNSAVPYSTFLGYGGYTNVEHLEEALASVLFHKEHDLPFHQCFVSQEGNYIERIPLKYRHLCVTIPREDLARLLETTRTDFIGAVAHPSKLGCMNSALFTEVLASYCIERFKGRCSLFEHSMVEKIVLSKESASLQVNGHTIDAHQVILCTNGFEHFTIENTLGTDIDTSFHHAIEGVVGYMASFYDTEHIPFDRWYKVDPSEIKPALQDNVPYFYITRRPFEAPPPYKGLVCVGGPEVSLNERLLYDPETEIDESVQETLLTFTKRTIRGAEKFKHGTFWHGLMGYTTSGVRLIGPEPCNPILMYNLGCNGVGILPSIYGARKIARHINNEVVEETIFDPQDVRCLLPSDTID